MYSQPAYNQQVVYTQSPSQSRMAYPPVQPIQQYPPIQQFSQYNQMPVYTQQPQQHIIQQTTPLMAQPQAYQQVQGNQEKPSSSWWNCFSYDKNEPEHQKKSKKQKNQQVMIQAGQPGMIYPGQLQPIEKNKSAEKKQKKKHHKKEEYVQYGIPQQYQQPQTYLPQQGVFGQQIGYQQMQQPGIQIPYQQMQQPVMQQQQEMDQVRFNVPFVQSEQFVQFQPQEQQQQQQQQQQKKEAKEAKKAQKAQEQQK